MNEIQKTICDIELKDIILYHGSRGGIDGEIQPISRVRCDFGRGFYMGENKDQAKGIVCEDQDPFLYTLRLNLSKADPDKILVLKDKDWLYTVLACRKKNEQFNQLEVAKQAIKRLEKYDIIVGPIADDRMNQAILRFSDQALTDEGLQACLQFVNYGNQYVLKTQNACKLVEILDEKQIKGAELDYIQQLTYEDRKKSKSVVEDMVAKYQRKGLYLNEIIQKEKEKEISNEGIKEHKTIYHRGKNRL